MFATFRDAVAQARRHGDLYFAALVDRETISDALGEASSLWQGWIYTPAVTVWVFLSQCLSPDHSCREAVARLAAWRTTQGLSALLGGYRRLLHGPRSAAGGGLPGVGPPHGPRTRSTSTRKNGCGRGGGCAWSMARRSPCPTPPENQAEYPQAKTQAPGCGLPIARVLVVFSLAVGSVLEAAIGQYAGKQTGENSLFRTLHHTLSEGDVVLADRYFSGWFDVALLAQRGVDVVVRKHQLRATDFRTGRATWVKTITWCGSPNRSGPSGCRPTRMRRCRLSLALREVRVRVNAARLPHQDSGGRDDARRCRCLSGARVAELYRRRWQAELHLRSLKVVLQMDHLRCKTPHRVRNEFYMHLLAYNLVRRVMALAAVEAKIPPWQISFKGTLQTLNNFLPGLASSMPLDAGCRTLVDGIAAHHVGNRPDRFEPRRIKRRPKSHDLLRTTTP